MHVPTLIAKKREGGELDPNEIAYLMRGYVEGSVADSQMSAFAMAVFFQGMTAIETAAMTREMILSGDVFDHPPGAPVVDKHSTGGIGDKVSVVLAPLVASAGCRVPMVSGRGLGITGGTLDKLESIPGFRVGISMAEAGELLDKHGVFLS
jgi:thymidine phosphorylase